MPQSKKWNNRRGRPGALSKFRTAQLVAEMNRRRGMLSQLHAAREKLAQQLELIDHDIADIESAGIQSEAVPPQPGFGRPRGTGKSGHRGNKQSLATLLHSLLPGKTMSVPEMAIAAKKAGHKTKSKNFRTIVGLALITHKKLFKRVNRGKYTAR